jgi:hypothetical protein
VLVALKQIPSEVEIRSRMNSEVTSLIH